MNNSSKYINERRPAIYHWDFLTLHELRTSLKSAVNEYLHNRNNLRILDIGCKNRPYFSIFKNYCKDCIGVDLEKGNFVDVIARMESLPFQNNDFDVVISTQVLEHVDNPQKGIKEVYRVLRPGGLVFLSTHGIWEEHGNDYWRWTSKGLKKIFQHFRKVQIVPHGNTLFAICQLNNMVLYQILNQSFFSKPLKLFAFIPLNLIGLLAKKFKGERLIINYLVIAQK